MHFTELYKTVLDICIKTVSGNVAVWLCKDLILLESERKELVRLVLDWLEKKEGLLWTGSERRKVPAADRWLPQRILVISLVSSVDSCLSITIR